ncbi:VCBS domain-containing protein [Roseibium sp. M-1]
MSDSNNILSNGDFEATTADEATGAVDNGTWFTAEAIEGWEATEGLIEIQHAASAGRGTPVDETGILASGSVLELDSYDYQSRCWRADGREADSTVSQSFTLEEASSFALGFSYAANCSTKTSDFSVTITDEDGNVVFFREFSDKEGNLEVAWQRFETDLDLDAGTYALSFSSAQYEDKDTVGALIDNVSLVDTAPRAANDAYTLDLGESEILTVDAVMGTETENVTVLDEDFSGTRHLKRLDTVASSDLVAVDGKAFSNACADGVLLFQPVDMTGLEAGTLSFVIDSDPACWSNFEAAGSRGGDYIRVEISVDGGEFILLDLFSVPESEEGLAGRQQTFVGSLTGQTFSSDGATLSYALPDGAETVQLRFVTDFSQFGEIVTFDDVLIEGERTVETGYESGLLANDTDGNGEALEIVSVEGIDLFDTVEEAVTVLEENFDDAKRNLEKHDTVEDSDLHGVDGVARTTNRSGGELEFAEVDISGLDNETFSFSLNADLLGCQRFESYGWARDFVEVQVRFDDGSYQTIDVFDVEWRGGQQVFVGRESGQEVPVSDGFVALSYDLAALAGDAETAQVRLIADASSHGEIFEVDDVSLAGTFTQRTGDGIATITLDSGAIVTIKSDGSFSYNANGQFAYLAEGEETTDTFSYTVQDASGNTDTATVTITLVGTNEGPMIGIADVSGSVTEIVDGAVGENVTPLSDTGSIAFTDVDLIDTHTVSVTPVSATNSLLGTVPARGTLSALVSDAATGDGAGEITWSFAVEDSAIDDLAEGEVITQVYTLTVDDGQGGTASETVTVTLTGTNDAPVITTVSGGNEGAVIEAGNLDDGTSVPGTPVVTGVLTASDVDTGATATWSGNATGTYGSFVIDPLTGAWTYTLDNAGGGTDALAEGEVVTETFTATVTDDFGATATQVVTVTVTGTNDSPVITTVSGGNEGAVIEAGNLDDGTSVPGTPVLTGVLTASDVDTGATATWSGDAAGTYGSFVIDPLTGAWTYTLDNANGGTDALAEGEVVTETFTATVTDDFGATATQVVTVTVTGTNDSPVITTVIGGNEGAVTEAGNLDDGTGVPGVPVATGILTASDVDTGATATWSGSAIGTYGSFVIDPLTGAWTYTLDNAGGGTDALAEGEVVTETFTATVTDDFGATATQVVIVTVTGTNDSPAITTAIGGNEGAVIEAGTLDDGTGVPGVPVATGVLTSSDVDTGATATWSGDAAGTYGSFVIDPLTGAWTYTLDNAFGGTDALAEGEVVTETFTATVTDEFGATATEDVTVTVTGANDAPVIDVVASDLSESVTAGYKTSGSFGAHDFLAAFDPASGTASVETVNGVEALKVNINDDSRRAPHTSLEIVEAGALEATDKVVITVNGEVTRTGSDQDIFFGLTDGTGQVSYFSVNGRAGRLYAGDLKTGSLPDDSIQDGGIATTPLDLSGPQLNIFTLQIVLDGQSDTITVLNSSGTVIGTFDGSGLTDGSGNPIDQTNALDPSLGLKLFLASDGTNETNYFVGLDYEMEISRPGTITFNDVDITDVHTASVSAVRFTGNANGLTEAQAKDLLDLTVNSSATDTVGSVDWDFALTDVDFAYLGVNEDLVIAYDVMVDDGNGGTDTETLTFTISGINDTPEIASTEVEVSLTEAEANGGQAIDLGAADDVTDVDVADTVSGRIISVTESGDGTGILSNEALLSFASLAAGNGGVVIAAGATAGAFGFAFDSDAAADPFNYLGAGQTLTLSYEVEVEDSAGATDTTTVIVNITGTNNAPEIGFPLVLSGEEDAVTPLAVDLLFGAYDADANAVLHVENLTLPAGFSLSGSTVLVDLTDASFQDLADGETRDIVLSYDVVDDQGAAVPQSLTVTVTGTNDGPVAAADSNTADPLVEEGFGIAGDATASGDVIANDSDVDSSDILSVVAVDAGTGEPGSSVMVTPGTTQVVLGRYGSLAINADGTWDYTLNNLDPDTDALEDGDTGIETFTYTISDGHGGEDTATLTLEVAGSGDNVAPQANDDAFVLGEDSPGALDLLGNDTDANNVPVVTQTLSVVSINGQAATVGATIATDHGTITIGSGGSVNYTPDAHYGGADSFTYVASDGLEGSNEASVSLDVAAVADAPLVSLTTAADQDISVVPAGPELSFTLTGSNPSETKAFALDDGGFMMTYRSVSNGGDVFAQRFDADGDAVGSAFTPVTATASNQGDAVGASLPDGGWVIAWSSYDSPNHYQVHFQRYDAAGAKVGTQTQVNQTNAAAQSDPDIAVLSDGSFVIAFTSALQDGSGDGVVARRFPADPAGTADAEFLVNADETDGSQNFSAITALTGGGYVIAYNSPDSNGNAVFAKVYSNDGTLAEEFQVNTIETGSQAYPAVAALAGGGFAIAYEDSAVDNSTGVMVRQYDASGQPVGTEEVHVNTFVQNRQGDANVTALADGGYLVSWESYGQQASGNYSIYGQRFDASGVPVGSEFRISDAPSGSQQFSRFAGGQQVIVLSDGRLVAVWEDSQQAFDVGGRIFTLPQAIDGAEGDAAVAIDLAVSLVDADGSETLEIVLSGFPQGATFNLGTADGPGWVISGAESVDLSTLTMTAPAQYNGSFDLSVAATASEGSNGDTATTTVTKVVTIAAVNDAPDVAAIDAGTVTEDDTAQIIDLLAGASDIDGDALSVENIVVTDDLGNPVTFADNGDGTITIDPDQFGDALDTGDSRTVTVSYDVSDGTDATPNTATLVIDGVTDNQAPTAQDVSVAPGAAGYEFGEEIGTPIQVSETDPYQNGTSTNDANSDNTPVVIGLSGGRYAVAWQENDQEYQGSTRISSALQIAVQVYDADDNPIGLKQTFGEIDQSYSNDDVDRAYDYQPKLTDLPDGGFALTWYGDYRSYTGTAQTRFERDVFIQVFDSDGVVQSGTPIQVSQTVSVANGSTTAYDAFQDTNPEIAGLADGGIAVTWSGNHYGDNNGSLDSGSRQVNVYLKVFDPDGTARSGEIPLGSDDRSYSGDDIDRHTDNDPQIAASDDGSFAVVWRGNYNTYSGTTSIEYTDDVYLQVFNADGTPQGAAQKVSQTVSYMSGVRSVDAYNDFSPEVAALKDGGYAVAWTGNHATYSGSTFVSSEYNIYVRVFDAGGQPVTAEISLGEVDQSDGNDDHDRAYDRDPKIVGTEDGGFVVTWRSDYNEYSGTTRTSLNRDIYVQRFDANGVELGTVQKISETVPYQSDSTVYDGFVDLAPVVTDLLDGGYVVAWQSEERTYDASNNFVSSEYSVRAQRFDADGVATGDLIKLGTVVQDPSGYDRSYDQIPQITALSDGGFAITWRNSTDYYNASGTHTDNTQDVFVSATHASGGGAELGDPIEVDVAALIDDPDLVDGDVLTVTVATGSNGSTATLTGTVITILPNVDHYAPLGAGETEDETFTYTVTDLAGAQVTATITLTVTGANDAPLAEDVAGAILEDGPAILIAADFSDADLTDTHTFSVNTTDTLGSVTDNGDGTFSYDPNGAFESLAAGETATDTFTYRVTDSSGTSSTATVTITLTGQNDAPTALAAEIANGYVFGDEAGAAQQVSETDLYSNGSYTYDANTDNNPVVIGFGDGAYAVAWEEVDADYNGATRITETRQVALQMYDADDNPIGAKQTFGEVDQSYANDDNDRSYDYQPRLTDLPDGGFALIWYGDYRNYSGTTTIRYERDVFVKVFGANGTELSASPIQLSQTVSVTSGSTTAYDAFQDYNPEVTALADGGIAVSWRGEHYGTSGGTLVSNSRESGVFVRAFDADGTERGAEVTLGSDNRSYSGDNIDRHYDYDNKIAASDDGSFAVVWRGDYNTYSGATLTGRTNDVYLQVFDANGVAQGGSSQVSQTVSYVSGSTTYDAFVDTAPEIAALKDGGYAVTWYGQHGTYSGSTLVSTQNDVYVRVFDASGQPVTGELTLGVIDQSYGSDDYDRANDQAPKIMATEDGGFIVTWQTNYYSYTGTIATSFSRDIMLQRFDADGVALAPVQKVSQTVPYQNGSNPDFDGYYDYNPEITDLLGGGFVVTWYSEQRDYDGSTFLGSRYSVLAQRFDEDGLAAGDLIELGTVEQDVSGTDRSQDQFPRVTALTDGGFAITWKNTTSNYDASGTYLGNTNDVLVSATHPIGNGTLAEGVVVDVADLIGDPDLPGGDTLTVRVDAVGSNGSTATVNGTEITIQPNLDHYRPLADGETETETFIYTVTDAAGLETTATLTFTAHGENDAPVIEVPVVRDSFAETIIDPSGADLTVPNSGYWFVVDFDAADGSRTQAIARGGSYGSVLHAEDTPANGVVVHLNPNSADWGVSATSYSDGVETIRDTSEFTYEGYSGATSATTYADTFSFLDSGSGVDVRWLGTDIDTPDGLYSFVVEMTGISFTDGSGFVHLDGVMAEAHPDADSGQIAFADPDDGDLHTATVTGVTVVGDAGLLNGADAFDFLKLDPVDQAADTVDWHFDMPETTLNGVLAGLADGDTLSFEFGVDIADLGDATDHTTLTVTLNSDGVFV